MGVTIFYRTRQQDEEKVRKMTEEIRDIAETMDWPYRTFDENWSEGPITDTLDDSEGNPKYVFRRYPLKGIFFRPHPDSEYVYMLFRPDGQLTSFLQAEIDADYPADGWSWTKTQFAGADTHIALIKLLRYLRDKYLHDLEVNDEGGYWESDDRQELARRLLMIDTGIEVLTGAVNNMPPEDIRDEDKLLKRIEEVLRQLRDRK